MSQFDFGTIDPNVKTGTQLAADLNQWRGALHTTHAGAARPAYATPGMLWVDQTSATDWKLKLATASGDTIIGGINPTTNVMLPLPGNVTLANNNFINFLNNAGVSWQVLNADAANRLNVGFQWPEVRIFTSGLERLTIGTTGALKALGGGTAPTFAADLHEFNQNLAAQFALSVRNASGTGRGLSLNLPGNSGTSTESYLQGFISSGANLDIRTNSGIVNNQANNVNTSDAQLKRDIGPAPDYTAFVGSLQYKRFGFVDQPGWETDGLIAQDLEALEPGLVTVAFEDKLGIYEHRLQQKINSVIPKLIGRLGELETRVTTLEGGPK